MSYEVIWSPEAKLTITQNMNYLAQEWDNKVLYQFLSQVEIALQKIKQNPRSYPLHKTTNNIRTYKINKRIVLYYKIINDSRIELITFWNTYRNPKDLKF